MSDLDPTPYFKLGKTVFHGVNIVGWVFDKGDSDTVAFYCPKNLVPYQLGIHDYAGGLNDTFYLFNVKRDVITFEPNPEVI